MKQLNHHKTRIIPILTFSIASILTACGGGSGGGGESSPPNQSNNVADTTAPIVVAPDNITVAATNEAGTAVSDDEISNFLNSVTASDNVDTNLVITNDSPDNIFPMGSTTVTFFSTDESGNTGSDKATVTIADLTPPVITLNGENQVTLIVGENYDEKGATALDNVDSDLIAPTRTGNVDTEIAGTYTLTYQAIDAAGNTASLTRKVNVICPIGEAVSDSKSHDCTYKADGTAQGNFRVKYPYSEWMSIGCSNGKPVADNSNTIWERKERAIRIVGGDWLNCPESDNYSAECICDPVKGENFHGISKNYDHNLGNGLTHGIDFPGGGFVFNNSGHQTCLGINSQGKPGEIESITSQPNGAHREESGEHHEECPIFCFGDACP